MEAKQEAQLVTQVRWRKETLRKLKKIKEEINGKKTPNTARVHQTL